MTNATDALRALPCPFCGSDEITVREGSTFRWRVAECGCGAVGPEARHNTMADDQTAANEASRIAAIHEWNTRATPISSTEVAALQAEVARLQAALAEARRDGERANYWKQRAKTAEGHLFASDLDAAAKALHRVAALRETPWDELTDVQRWGLNHAAMQVIAAVNERRDSRKPDAALHQRKDAESTDPPTTGDRT